MEAFHHSFVAIGETPQRNEGSLLRHLAKRKCAPEPNLLAGVLQCGEQHFVRSLAMAMGKRLGRFTPDGVDSDLFRTTFSSALIVLGEVTICIAKAAAARLKGLRPCFSV